MPPPELTLILAATRDMGIGLNGTLPWTGLRQEMAYFARVTKRFPTSSATHITHKKIHNAVIMGRKTWDSIPPRFRPLKGRLNIVISRNAAAAGTPPARDDVDLDAGPVILSSLERAVEYLQRQGRGHDARLEQKEDQVLLHQGDGTTGEESTRDQRRGKSQDQDQAQAQMHSEESAAGRIFIIGGAQIYGAALALPQTRRILLTRVLSNFECDTFFPLLLREGTPPTGWTKSTKAELDAWVGETVAEGVQEENGTRYEFEMWERVD